MTAPKTVLFCPRISFQQVFTWRINLLISLINTVLHNILEWKNDHCLDFSSLIETLFNRTRYQISFYLLMKVWSLLMCMMPKCHLIFFMLSSPTVINSNTALMLPIKGILYFLVAPVGWGFMNGFHVDWGGLIAHPDILNSDWLK